MRAPAISVVLTSSSPDGCITECLSSLRQQTLAAEAEVIVAERSTGGADGAIQKSFPGVRMCHADQDTEIPELLREGLRLARGRIVVVTDSSCVFAPDWLEKLSRAHAAPYDVIGGAVEMGRPNGLVSWACYFADYAAFMLPNHERETSWLAGNHLSYKREVIEKVVESQPGGFVKPFVHEELARKGAHFFFDPELVAYYRRRNTLRSFLRTYLHNGRLFAGLRTTRMSRRARFWHVITAPALPLYLLWQRLVPGLGNERHRAKFLLSIPLLALFVTIWSAGELAGYICGSKNTARGTRS